MKFETMTAFFTAHEPCATARMPESMQLRSFAPMTAAAWNLTRSYLDNTVCPAATKEVSSFAEETPAEHVVLDAVA